MNGSVYIEKDQIHRLENETDKPLVLIEVQIGAHIAEDDITRFDDQYGRA
ncbi:MAG: hypothetical protein ABI459_06580 [Deltaproteobacteria bacterium]